MAAVPWELLVLVIGIVYGYAKPGKQSKWQIFKTGLLIGIVLALLFAILGAFGDLRGLSADALGTGVVSIVVGVVILTIIFIVGVWIGDILE